MAVSFQKYRIPDELWVRLRPLLPSMKKSPLGGRPSTKNLRPIADAIFYKMRTGCQWNAIPRSFAPSSTVHDYFQRWVESGTFEKLWELMLAEYDDVKGVSWKHQALDVAIVKAPFGGEKNRCQPNGSGQAWMQTLRPGRRPRRTIELRLTGSKSS